MRAEKRIGHREGQKGWGEKPARNTWGGGQRDRQTERDRDREREGEHPRVEVLLSAGHT